MAFDQAIGDNGPEAVRLLVASSHNRNSHLVSNVIRKNVKRTFFTYENSSLDDILASIIAELGGIKVETIAFILHGTETEMFLAQTGSMVVSSIALEQNQSIQEFFICLSSTFMNSSHSGARIDFLDCSIKDKDERSKISQLLMKMSGCPVGLSGDLYGTDISLASDNNQLEKKVLSVGELYFFIEKMDELLNSSIQRQVQNLSGYELVRTVGKGAFGTAVLYRKKADDTLVIVKKINMHDLTASERQLAINEVRVLAMLNHENIISYYDSFEEDGVLMIEMEYADGGNMAQFLSQIKSPLEEKEILLLFKQIVLAIRHMHDHNILHRDLKTANIFLTKEGIIKVGDFGISKMLTTRQGGALTVVGTPYYISPEMCEGKLYNQKSDMWALGCILYEMACQQKTFEGSNLPALVNKIVKGQFAPVKGNYSQGFKQLIRDLLQRDPDFRPSAAEILDVRLPELMKSYEESSNKDYDDTEISMDFDFQGQSPSAKNTVRQPLRSVLYDIKMHQADISLTPVSLPPRSKIKEVALSSTHMIVLTSELLVYTWGDGRKGQLGHGKLETWRDRPLCVNALKGKNITRICAGEGFSVFSSDNGIVMTCGNGSKGCLGHGDWNLCVKPKLIEKLLSVDVSTVSCGPQHVVVVGGEGEAYAWGSGAGGRLGTGTEEDCCLPTEVQFSSDIRAIRAYCGYDGTMFVTDTGALLACGKNDFNKLGLNEQRGFLSQMKQFISKTEVEKQLVPVKLNWLRQQVVSVSMGATHTAILVEPGKIITFGGNKSGQLGRGNLRVHSPPSLVKSMGDRTVTMVQCGDTFTVAGTAENAIYFWGSRQVLSGDHPRKQLKESQKIQSKNYMDTTEMVSEISETSVSEVIKVGESNSPLMREIERIGPDSPIIQVKTPDFENVAPPTSAGKPRSLTASSNEDETRDNLVDSCTGRKDIVLHPQEILALYASPAQIAKGEIVKLANLYCFGLQVYLVVDTTAPLPKADKKPKPPEEIPQPASSGTPTKLQMILDKNCDIPDEDSLGPIPEWLKNELANATTNVWAKPQSQLKNPGSAASETDVHKISNSHRCPVHSEVSVKENVESSSENALRLELEKMKIEKMRAEDKLKKLEQKMAERNNPTENHHSYTRNDREKELQKEIVKLREQLELQLKNPKNYKVQNQENQYPRKYSKQNTWVSSQGSKRKHNSKICSIQ